MNKLWSHLKIKVIKIKCKWGRNIGKKQVIQDYIHMQNLNCKTSNKK